METLIELYDERPIENVLATEVFRPVRTVFLCPPQIAEDRRNRERLERYFAHRGVGTELIFLESSLYSASKVAEQIRKVSEKYPGCVVDITGGTDAALFACGTVCAELGLPAFTYSRKMRCFYGIYNTTFSDPLPCTVSHTVEDCFLMAGGALRRGRVDNGILGKYEKDFEPFFDVYLRNKTEWNRAVSYIQRVSQTDRGDRTLKVSADRTVRGERGNRIEAPETVLKDLAGIGFLRCLRIGTDRVTFTFRDEQIRTWLRDVGSVLELYIYKLCRETGLFSDIRTSAVVDWEAGSLRDSVTNEIDVMAMDGIIPLFISCKTCAIDTDALNELAILRDRFGGKGAKAAAVTSQRCRSVTRNRAAELGIIVIDLDDIRAGRVAERIAAMIRAD